MELTVPNEKLIRDNPRDRLIARLQSLQTDRKAENQKIKALENQVKKDRKKAQELMRLDAYRPSHTIIFKKLVEKYLGFPDYQILGPNRDEKSIAALEEILVAKAKKNMIIGIAIALLIPLAGWAALIWIILEGLNYREEQEYGTGEIARPLKFFRLQRRLKKNDVDTSPYLTEYFS